MTPYDLGQEAALEKFAIRRGEKIIRDMWMAAPQPSAKDEKVKAETGQYPASYQDRVNKHREKVMAKAKAIDVGSKHTAFKPFQEGGAQLNPRRAGEYGGGMEGVATPVIAAGSPQRPGGVMVRKHYFPEAEVGGLAQPRILEAKRRILNANLPQLPSWHGPSQDVRGGALDFLENIPSRVDASPFGQIRTGYFGARLNQELPRKLQMGDLHHENVLVTPSGKRRVVDFIPQVDNEGRMINFPWQFREEMEAARKLQNKNNPPIQLARRLDSPEAAKAKIERGGYAEDPYKRIERLKKQRAEFQARQATPEARQKMREMNKAKAVTDVPAPAAASESSPFGAKLKGLLERFKKAPEEARTRAVKVPDLAQAKPPPSLAATRITDVPQFINPPGALGRFARAVQKRLPRR